MTKDDVIAAARECLETPFAHQGRAVGTGLDCAGVLCHVASRLGVEYDAPENYPRQPYQGLLQAVLDRQPGLERVSTPQPGDILLMRFKSDPQHLAVMTDVGIVHAYESVKKCCEHRLDPAWRSRIVATYRFRGVE